MYVPDNVIVEVIDGVLVRGGVKVGDGQGVGLTLRNHLDQQTGTVPGVKVIVSWVVRTVHERLRGKLFCHLCRDVDIVGNVGERVQNIPYFFRVTLFSIDDTVNDVCIFLLFIRRKQMSCSFSD